MYSVILVEDEDIIRRGIKNSVPWEEFNCSVVGEARNGEEGGALIAERNPDIVITDINADGGRTPDDRQDEMCL